MKPSKHVGARYLLELLHEIGRIFSYTIFHAHWTQTQPLINWNKHESRLFLNLETTSSPFIATSSSSPTKFFYRKQINTYYLHGRDRQLDQQKVSHANFMVIFGVSLASGTHTCKTHVNTNLSSPSPSPWRRSNLTQLNLHKLMVITHGGSRERRTGNSQALHRIGNSKWEGRTTDKSVLFEGIFEFAKPTKLGRLPQLWAGHHHYSLRELRFSRLRAYIKSEYELNWILRRRGSTTKFSSVVVLLLLSRSTKFFGSPKFVPHRTPPEKWDNEFWSKAQFIIVVTRPRRLRKTASLSPFSALRRLCRTNYDDALTTRKLAKKIASELSKILSKVNPNRTAAKPSALGGRWT